MFECEETENPARKKTSFADVKNMFIFAAQN